MRRLLICLIIFIAALYGCDTNTLEGLSDDSGTQADIEDARIALDDGNYDKAISLLADDYDTASPDPEIASILASAYMGKAGVDLTYALGSIEKYSGNYMDIFSTAMSLEIISQGSPQSSQLAGYKALPAEDATWYISADSVAVLMGSMEDAIDTLTVLLDYYNENDLNPDDDAVVQLGLASTLHIIMKIGFVVSEVTGYNIPVNQKAYLEVFPEDSDWASLLDETAAYLDAHPEDMESLKADLRNMFAAAWLLIDLIGADEDFTVKLDGFACDFLGLPVSASKQAVTDAISSYSGSDLAGFVHNTLLGYE